MKRLMTNSTIYLTLAALGLAGAACSTSADQDTTAQGVASFEDAQTDSAGDSREPARPEPQDVDIEIRVEGTGVLSGLEPQCSVDELAGAFEAQLFGEAFVDDDGAYVAGMSSADALVQTPSGCEVPDLEVSAVTDVVIRGTIAATTHNCEAYCAAKARSQAEAACGAEASAADCRAAEEASYDGSCELSCTAGPRYVIAAETRLSASAVAALSLESLTAVALGAIEADLTFDHIEDEDGEPVSEAP